MSVLGDGVNEAVENGLRGLDLEVLSIAPTARGDGVVVEPGIWSEFLGQSLFVIQNRDFLRVLPLVHCCDYFD